MVKFSFCHHLRSSFGCWNWSTIYCLLHSPLTYLLLLMFGHSFLSIFTSTNCFRNFIATLCAGVCVYVCVWGVVEVTRTVTLCLVIGIGWALSLRCNRTYGKIHKFKLISIGLHGMWPGQSAKTAGHKRSMCHFPLVDACAPHLTAQHSTAGFYSSNRFESVASSFNTKIN